MADASAPGCGATTPWLRNEDASFELLMWLDLLSFQEVRVPSSDDKVRAIFLSDKGGWSCFYTCLEWSVLNSEAASRLTAVRRGKKGVR